MGRYESSMIFRNMIWSLSVVWTTAFYLFAVVFGVLVFRLPTAAVYAVGWAGPFPLGGLMAMGTIFYVQSTLKEERRVKEGNEDVEPASRQHGSTMSQDERTPLLSSTE